VVGSAATRDDSIHAFLYDESATPRMRDLGTFGGSESWAYAINNSGKVTGYAATSVPYPYHHAFLYSGGKMRDLGTLGGTESWAFDLNEADKVVGSANLSGDSENHAFLYDASATPRMRDLGTLGGSHSMAFGINDSEQVVGSAATRDDSIHAFLYSGGKMRDLNSLIPANSGWELVSAEAINDKGHIVGYGANKDSVGRAFLLTPDSTAPTVTSTVPTGTTPVAPTINVRAFFSEDMQSATVKSAFKLFKKGSDTKIDAAFGYDDATDTATLNPTNNLRRGVTYKAVVTTVAKDLAGNQLDQNPSLDGPQQKKWFFTIKR
jgi:probable HAF family extracellular repeat protein